MQRKNKGKEGLQGTDRPLLLLRDLSFALLWLLPRALPAAPAAPRFAAPSPAGMRSFPGSFLRTHCAVVGVHSKARQFIALIKTFMQKLHVPMLIRPMSSAPGRPQHHIQAQGVTRLPGEQSTSKAGHEPASISENVSESYIWLLEPRLGSHWEKRPEALC